VEHLADEEPTYVPVSIAAVSALRVVQEVGGTGRCVFQSRWYPCLKQWVLDVTAVKTALR